MPTISRVNVEYLQQLLTPGTSTFIAGLRGSGKTYLTRQICRLAPQVFAIDPMDEYGDLPNVTAYYPENRTYTRQAMDEINQAIEFMHSMEARPSLFVFDEVSRYAPSKRNPPEGLAEINDLMAHYGLAAVYIARRPADVWTSLVEISNFMILFRLVGRNDHLYLRDRASPQVAELVGRLRRFEHLFVDADRNGKVMPPLPG